jgi:hypothetical protein
LSADDGLVTSFRRASLGLTDLRSIAARRLTLVLGAAAALSVSLLFAAAPAGAVVTTVGVQKYGVEPQSVAPASVPTTPLSYEGGAVVHSNAPYALYWDPGDRYAAWEGLTAGFLEGVGGASGTLSNVYAVATQYRESPVGPTPEYNYNSSFRGAYTDIDNYPSTENCAETGAPCLTDAQIRTELTKYISANGLPTGLNTSTGGTPNPTPIYFVFTPPNVTVCLDTTKGHCSTAASTEPLCSYHSHTTVNGATVLYAVMPWTITSSCQNGSGTLEEPNRLVEGYKSEAQIIINEIADEQVATVTDPLLTAWHDTGSNTDEVPDKCRNDFLPLIGVILGEEFNQSIGGVNYYLNDEFDQAALYAPYPGEPCINKVTVNPQFTAQSPVRTGDQVTFNTTESDVSLGIAKYNWNFGDGTTVEVNCGAHTPTYGYAPAECDTSSGTGNPNSVASVVHTYAHSGTYGVKLTVTDDGGHLGSVTHPITVVPTQQEEEEEAKAQAKSEAEENVKRAAEAKAKSEAEENAKRAAEAKAKSEAEAKAKSEAEAKAKSEAEAKAKSEAEVKASAVPAPVATAAVVSKSLRQVLRNGLVIRYSVNEQVAGRFEVLLAASIARHIGLHGPLATGLAAGTPPQIVIAKAILITTRGGHSTIKIQFGKVTAARLHRLHKVSLMLRMIVHNASSGSPVTVLSTVVLHG